MLASQMSDALFDSTTVDVLAPGTSSGDGYIFRAKGSVLKFAGFRAVYMETRDDVAANGDDDETDPLPELERGDAIDTRSLAPNSTSPSPRRGTRSRRSSRRSRSRGSAVPAPTRR